MKEWEKLLRVYKIVEAILNLKNDKNILEKALNSLVYIEKGKNIFKKEINSSMLFVLENDYYKVNEQLLRNSNDNIDIFPMLESVSEECPNHFINNFFEIIIEEVSNYPSLFFSLKQSDSIDFLKIIQENIIQIGFIPSNIDKLIPWIELMNLINKHALNREKLFEEFKFFFEKPENIPDFTNVNDIKKILLLIRNKIQFVEKSEGKRKILKVACNLFSIIVSNPSPDFNFFKEILLEIDDTNEYWQYSSKIFFYLDDNLVFSSSLIDFNYDIESVQKFMLKNKGFISDFESLVKNSPKILNLFLNRTFSLVCIDWISKYDNYEEILENKINIFVEIHEFLKKSPSDFLLYFCLVWLKSYLYFYSLSCHNGKLSSHVAKAMEKLILEKQEYNFTIQIYLLKLLLSHSNKKNLHEIKNERN